MGGGETWGEWQWEGAASCEESVEGMGEWEEAAASGRRLQAVVHVILLFHPPNWPTFTSPLPSHHCPTLFLLTHFTC